jgi:hypothetical protein
MARDTFLSESEGDTMPGITHNEPWPLSRALPHRLQNRRRRHGRGKKEDTKKEQKKGKKKKAETPKKGGSR